MLLERNPRLNYVSFIQNLRAFKSKTLLQTREYRTIHMTEPHPTTLWEFFVGPFVKHIFTTLWCHYFCHMCHVSSYLYSCSSSYLIFPHVPCLLLSIFILFILLDLSCLMLYCIYCEYIYEFGKIHEIFATGQNKVVFC